MATTRKRTPKPHQLTADGATGALARPPKLQRRGSKPATVPEILAAAVTRDGKVLPTWPEKGTGRTAALAVCGHCGGKPLIIRLCGHTASGIRYCAVCEKCGAHRAIQAAPGSAAI